MGRTVLITGATDGLGRALAARAHADRWIVLAHGRSDAKLAALADALPGIRTFRADLASLAAVDELARAVQDATERLDALVSNAGIGFTEPGGGDRLESADGHELRFAVNYLAGYSLTRRLLPLLRASAPARIVQVASAGQVPIDFDDVMLERSYDGVRAYRQSKLAQVMFTFDLAAELDGSGVTATTLHPATFMATNMVRDAGLEPVSTVEQGLEATWRLVADPALDRVTGAYFNGTHEARAAEQAYDPAARRALRELSQRLTSRASASRGRRR
jgi:NAD(P)-dependent dehydrogenase (short-subunit alcohol dehydrogenase family)